MRDKMEKTKSPFDAETEDETIALSKDELDNILAEAEIVQDTASANSVDKAIDEDFGLFEEDGAKKGSAAPGAGGEEFDISGEIDELSPEDLENIELEESEVDSYTKELEGEFGGDFDLSEGKEGGKGDDSEGIDTEELDLEADLGAELGGEMDIDSYLDSVKGDIDLEAIDLEGGEGGIVESPVLGDIEGLGEAEVPADKAFKEAGIEVTDEELSVSEAEEKDLIEGLVEGLPSDEELAEIGEGLSSIEGAAPAEESLGTELKLTDEEDELLSKDFDLAIEGAPESEEVITVSGDELEKMVEGKPLDLGKTARRAGENGSTAIDSTLLGDITVILKYMDSLLEDLPEEKIKDFAKSKYFVLYKQVFEKLNIA
jgi:pilus assembly protein FimV